MPLQAREGFRKVCFAAVLGGACGTPSSSDTAISDASSSATASGAASTDITGISTTTTTTTTASTTTTVDPDTTSSGSSTSNADGTTGEPDMGVLDIYWIDTEGGAATLLATPEGPLVLIDAGFPGDRDADRIAAIVQDELGADAIDLCIVTHYHLDHVGGVPDLVQRVPIEAFWDHGDSVEAGWADGLVLWQDYLAVADGRRTIVMPGEVHEIGGIELTIVSAAMNVIDMALPSGGGDNPACAGATNLPPDTGENGNSIGFLARFGGFEMLDLGDLTWSYEDALACPLGLLGTIDLYQTTHHGLAISGATQLVHGIDPLVVVMNNGAHKGGASQTFDRIGSAPSAPELWQSHLALDNDAAHNAPEDRIANLEEGELDVGHVIHARIDSGGAITVTNRRNDHARAYQSR